MKTPKTTFKFVPTTPKVMRRSESFYAAMAKLGGPNYSPDKRGDVAPDKSPRNAKA